jgi:hypothetical protein
MNKIYNYSFVLFHNLHFCFIIEVAEVTTHFTACSLVLFIFTLVKSFYCEIIDTYSSPSPSMDLSIVDFKYPHISICVQFCQLWSVVLYKKKLEIKYVDRWTVSHHNLHR